MGVLLVITIAIIGYIFVTYNSLVSRKNKIRQAYSGIDVYLTQRFDLIPNLVECVKGYMAYEEETFEKIVTMRQEYLNTKSLKEGETLNYECNRIIMMAEDYPELKSSEQFLNLQKNLSKIESQLQAARRIYNAEVNVYNNKVQMFPSNILAGMFGFQEAEYFEAEEQSHHHIKIDTKEK